MIRTKITCLLLLLVISSLLIIPASAFFPANTTDTITRDPIYAVDTFTIPWQIWALFFIPGLLFLGISVCYPMRGELITGVLALMFLTVSWLTSPFIAVWEVESAIMTVEGVQMLVSQPVVILMQPAQIPYICLGLFLIGVLNFLLGVLNMLTASVKRRRGGFE